MAGYKGIRVPSGRTPRTLAEDMGTNPKGFTGALTYSPDSGTMVTAGLSAGQSYKDEATAAQPASFVPRGGSEVKSW